MQSIRKGEDPPLLGRLFPGNSRSGFQTCHLQQGQKWLRYLELFGELSVGEGRVLHGPGFYASDWIVVTDYATRNFGCPGITTETFPCGEIGCVGLDWRIKQNVGFVKATLDVLEEGCK